MLSTTDTKANTNVFFGAYIVCAPFLYTEREDKMDAREMKMMTAVNFNEEGKK